MAAAPKPVKYLGGAIMSAQDLANLQYTPPARPMDMATLAQAVIQLQNTVNELIARYNSLTAAASLPQASLAVTGAGQAATNLFTNN